ncbi:hypothetical protein NXV09_20425 [Parabacteroides distasonis]|nr:hypothetical protein [Parabacteroides distasonis]
MKRIIVFFAVVVQMLLLPCCVEKQGYYSSGEESIIALICDITWTGGKKEYEDGSSWESIWNFDKDGTYTRTNVEIDKDGNKKKVRFVEDGLLPLLTLAYYTLVVVIIGILKS